MPARTVPPTPGTTLQLKVQSNLEKSLGSHFDIQIDQKMGAFQASMLEAVNSLCLRIKASGGGSDLFSF